MDLSAHNLPQAYVDFINGKVGEGDDFYYYFNREELDNPQDGNAYILWNTSFLERSSYGDNSPNWKYLQDPEFYYKGIEGDVENLTKEDVLALFVIGLEDGGGFIFKAPSNALYVIYSDLYVKKLANSFEEFMTYAVPEDELDSDWDEDDEYDEE